MALLAYVASVTVDSMPNGDQLSSQRCRQLYAADECVRNLRSSTKLMEKGHTNMSEERAILIDAATAIRDFFSKIYRLFQPKLPLNTQYLDGMLADLRLVKNPDTDKTEEIYKLIDQYNPNVETNHAAIHSSLERYFEDEQHLLDFLLKGLESQQWYEIAYYQLLHLVLNTWHGKTADEVFELLKVKASGVAPFQKPAIYLWLRFILRNKPAQKARDMLKEHYPDFDLDAALTAEMNVDITDPTVLKGLVSVLGVMWKGKTANDVFKALQIDKERVPTIKDPVFGNWAAFVHESRYGDDAFMMEATNALVGYYTLYGATKLVVEAREHGETEHFYDTMFSFIEHKMSSLTWKDYYEKLDLAKMSLYENFFKDPVYRFWVAVRLAHDYS